MQERSYVDYSRGDGFPFGLIMISCFILGVLCLSRFGGSKPEPPKATKPQPVKSASSWRTCKGKIVGITTPVRPHPAYDVGRSESHVVMLDRLGRHVEFYVYTIDNEHLVEGNHVNLVVNDPDPENSFRTREIVSITPLYKREHRTSYGDLKTNGSF